MLLRLEPNADLGRVRSALQGLGLWVRVLRSSADGPDMLRIEPHSRAVSHAEVAAVEGVREVLSPGTEGAARAQARMTLQTRHGGQVEIGGERAVLVAGPCAVESADQIARAAEMAAEAGARLLRGGAFKPRTSPHAFTGWGPRALGWMDEAARAFGLGLVTEVMAPEHVAEVAEIADLLQVGTRNMDNLALLDAIGATGKPVLLKRGRTASVAQWLAAVDRLMAAGAPSVLPCERGVLGGGGETRNLLDVGAIALMRHVHGQVVAVDPSHACGRRDLVTPLALAGVAAGASLVLVECHPDAAAALSDGAQSLNRDELNALRVALAV